MKRIIRNLPLQKTKVKALNIFQQIIYFLHKKIIIQGSICTDTEQVPTYIFICYWNFGTKPTRGE